MSFKIVIQELRRPSNKYNLHVKWYTSIKDIKDQLHKLTNFPIQKMHLFFPTNSLDLKNQLTLHDIGIDFGGCILHLAVDYQSISNFSITQSKELKINSECEKMLNSVISGLKLGQNPKKTDQFDCTGGVYFMRSSKGNFEAVFKPGDEEQGMPNNPKGHSGNGEHGLRPFFKPGEGYIRETASYILDVNNFCQVPPTTIIHCEHRVFNYSTTGHIMTRPKQGSLQKFIEAFDLYENISPSLISDFELQKIALLDMRLLNSDRNESNILVLRKQNSFCGNYLSSRRNSRSSSLSSYGEPDEIRLDGDDVLCSEHFQRFSYTLVPIDHGYCLPTKLKISELDWCWFFSPQIDREVDPEIKEYVRSLDVEKIIIDLSSQILLSEDTLFLLRVTHYLIKEGVNLGLTLKSIASMIVRVDENCPSPLENILEIAEENAFRTLEMRTSSTSLRGMGESSPIRRKDSWSSNTFSSRNSSKLILASEEMSPKFRKAINSELCLENIDPSSRSNINHRYLKNCQSNSPNNKIIRKFNIDNNERSNSHSPDYFMIDLGDSLIEPIEDESQKYNENSLFINIGLNRKIRKSGEPLSYSKTLDSVLPTILSSHPEKNNETTIPMPFYKKSDSNEYGYTSSEASSNENGSPRSFGESFIANKMLSLISLNSKDSCFPNQASTSNTQCIFNGQINAPPKNSSLHTVNIQNSGECFRKPPISPPKSFFSQRWAELDNENNDTDSEKDKETQDSNSSYLKRSNGSNRSLSSDYSIKKVASFSEFKSPALYDTEIVDRKFFHLKSEKRKDISRSTEFLKLRLSYALDTIQAQLNREIKTQRSSTI